MVGGGTNVKALCSTRVNLTLEAGTLEEFDCCSCAKLFG